MSPSWGAKAAQGVATRHHGPETRRFYTRSFALCRRGRPWLRHATSTPLGTNPNMGARGGAPALGNSHPPPSPRRFLTCLFRAFLDSRMAGVAAFCCNINPTLPTSRSAWRWLLAALVSFSSWGGHLMLRFNTGNSLLSLRPVVAASTLNLATMWVAMAFKCLSCPTRTKSSPCTSPQTSHNGWHVEVTGGHSTFAEP